MRLPRMESERVRCDTETMELRSHCDKDPSGQGHLAGSA